MPLETLWNFEAGGPVSGCPALIDSDDGINIVFGSDDGDVICLASDGKERWRDQIGQPLSGWPVVTELAGSAAFVCG